MAKVVSKTYGEALWEIAMEKEAATPGAAEEFIAELDALTDILEKEKKFGELIAHPGISKTDKLEVVKAVFEGRISPEFYEFLHLLVDKGRYRDLPEIMEYLIAMKKEWLKIGVVYVTTAVPLNKEQERQIEQRILETTQYERLEMHYDVDEELIGGMMIRIGDRVVDSTIKRKLNDLTRQLLQIQLSEGAADGKA